MTGPEQYDQLPIACQDVAPRIDEAIGGTALQVFTAFDALYRDGYPDLPAPYYYEYEIPRAPGERVPGNEDRGVTYTSMPKTSEYILSAFPNLAAADVHGRMEVRVPESDREELPVAQILFGNVFATMWAPGSQYETQTERTTIGIAVDGMAALPIRTLPGVLPTPFERAQFRTPTQAASASADLNPQAHGRRVARTETRVQNTFALAALESLVVAQTVLQVATICGLERAEPWREADRLAALTGEVADLSTNEAREDYPEYVRTFLAARIPDH